MDEFLSSSLYATEIGIIALTNTERWCLVPASMSPGLEDICWVYTTEKAVALGENRTIENYFTQVFSRGSPWMARN